MTAPLSGLAMTRWSCLTAPGCSFIRRSRGYNSQRLAVPLPSRGYGMALLGGRAPISRIPSASTAMERR